MGRAEILERIERSGLPVGVREYCADIFGVKGGQKYVFEVCCIQTSNDLASADHLFDSLGTSVATSGKKPVVTWNRSTMKSSSRLTVPGKNTAVSAAG